MQDTACQTSCQLEALDSASSYHRCPSSSSSSTVPAGAVEVSKGMFALQ